MSLFQAYPTFIIDVQAEIARRGSAISQRLEDGDSFDEVLEDIFRLRNLIQELENYFVTDNDVVDIDGNSWFSYIRYKCSGRSKDHEIEVDMQRIYKEYCINTYPGMLFPVAPIYIDNGWVGGGGSEGPDSGCCGIPPYPPGAGSGDYYLSVDIENNTYTWVQNGSFIYRKEFLWNGGSQEFTLNVQADRIHMVFVNGQLLPQWAYKLEGYVLTLLNPPIVLDNSRNPVRVIVFAGLAGAGTINVDTEGFNEIRDENGNPVLDASMDRFLTFVGVGVNVLFDPVGNKIIIDASDLLNGLLFKEEFVWTAGGQSFTLDNPAAAIVLFSINGQIQGSSDIEHTTGNDIVTVIDQLEPGDEIMILYTRSNT